MPNKRDYYEILGVSKTVSQDELKKAYRKKALEFHPDRNKAADAETKFKQVNEAYEVLSNPQKRQTYDQFGHAAFDPSSGMGGFSGRGGNAGPFSYTYYSRGSNEANPFGDFSDPFDIFETFFGGSSPFRQARSKPHYSLKIGFMEAVKGTQKTIIHQGKQHNVKIPPGADSGTRIRFADFDVSVEVLPDKQFKRDGQDVFLDYEIPFTMAALGGEIKVPTVDQSSIKLKIRPGTQPNTMIRLKDKGIPYIQRKSRGDAYIRLIVKVPTQLSREAKDLLKKLDGLV